MHIQANYVESILNKGIYKPLAGWAIMLIEIAATVAIGILLLNMRPEVMVTIVCLFLLLISYFLLHFGGTFYDFFIPVLLILSHFAIEKIREWRKKAIEYDKQQQADEE